MVLLVIAYHADDTGGCSFPDLPLICKEAKLSERGVRYALRELETLGEITTTIGRGKGHLTTYVVNLPIESEDEAKGATIAPLQSKQKGQMTAEKGQSVPLSNMQKGQMTTAKGANYSAKGANDDMHIGRTVITVMNRHEEKDMSGGQVREVFAYWQSRLNHQQSKLTDGRQTKIKARLGEGYSVSQIKQAIDGCACSAFHQGENDQRTVYDDITLICRNGEKLENFIRLEENGNGKIHHGQRPIPRNETHNERAARETFEWIEASLAATVSDPAPDPENAVAPWPAIDIGQ